MPSPPPPIAAAPTSVAAFIGRAPSGPDNTAVRCSSYSDFLATFGGQHPANEMAWSVREFFANGGTDCYVVRLARPDTAGDAPTLADYEGLAATRTGLYALDATPGFNLLIIPRDTGVTEQTRLDVVSAASRFCRDHRAFLLLDAAIATAAGSGDLRTDMALLAPLLAAENAAIFYPDLIFAADSVPTGPSGAVAGIMARTDTTRGVWKAAAGNDATLAGNPALSMQLGQNSAQAVIDAGANPLRLLNGHTLVWGARTIAARGGGTDWKYIPVRRLALFLEASIENGLRWAVFEPNDQQLWSRVRADVENFLIGIWRAGALAGAKSDEAFFVRCGPDTMTADEIARGDVNVLVGFAPLKPAEFIPLRIRLKRAGALLLAGTNRTGKTMTASVIAAGLGLTLHRVDLARLVSKYVGETEKKLDRLLARAKSSGALLFFDEADALFGKRTSVRDAHDRYANLEIDYLLKRIENHGVPVIVATNRRGNIDQHLLQKLAGVVDLEVARTDEKPHPPS